jgi:hypothetical protein
VNLFDLGKGEYQNLELSCKLPQIGVLASSFAKTGDEINCQDENIKQGILIKRTKTGFLT